MADPIGKYQSDYESLRLILEKERKRPVTIEGAIGIGDNLIEFYETLLRAPIVKEKDDEHGTEGRA